MYDIHTWNIETHMCGGMCSCVCICVEICTLHGFPIRTRLCMCAYHCVCASYIEQRVYMCMLWVCAVKYYARLLCLYAKTYISSQCPDNETSDTYTHTQHAYTFAIMVSSVRFHFLFVFFFISKHFEITKFRSEYTYTFICSLSFIRLLLHTYKTIV